MHARIAACVASDRGSTASQSGRLIRIAVTPMTTSIDSPTIVYVSTRPSVGDSTVIATPHIPDTTE